MKKFLFITLFSIKIIQPQWQMLDGPYETCEVTNLFTHPNGTMFAGSDDPPNGIPAIFRSLNSGSSWSKVSNNINIRNDGVKSIASDPQGNIYVGSWGEFYYSSDNGDNWTTKNLYHSAAINSIVFNNLGNIFLGTSGDSPGIYRSEIGGNIWTLLLNKQTADLLIDENNNIYAATTEGIFFSSDNGSSWIQRNNGLPVALCRNICQNSLGELFANIYNNGIFKSIDNGLNWNIINSSSPTNLWDIFIDKNDFIYACKWVSWGVGLKGIHRSGNSGISWDYLGLNNVSTIYFVSVDLQNNLFAGTDRALFKYSEQDSTWLLGNIYIELGDIRSFAFCSDNSILASTSMRLWISNDLGDSWSNLNDRETPVIINGDGTRMIIANPLMYSDNCGINWNNSNITFNFYSSIHSICNSLDYGLFAGVGTEYYKSDDNGLSWQFINQFFYPYLDYTKDIALNSLGHIFISQFGNYAGFTFRTIRSVDNGNTSQSIYLANFVSSIEIDKADNIFIGTSGNGILKSTDNGDSWLTINNGLTNLYINDMRISPDGILLAATNNGVHRLIDSPSYWILLDTSGLVTKRISSIQFHNHDLYVGTDHGIGLFIGQLPVELTLFMGYFSNPEVHLNWSTQTELNNHGFEIERSIDKAIWATIGFREGKGTTSEPQEYAYSDDISEISSSKLFYRLKQIDFNGSFEYSDVVEVEIAPTKFSLQQNYPNPFNPTTKISWQSPVSDWQTLKVYDVLGNEVATLVNEEKLAGKYEMEFDASNLSSGVYYYQLRSSNFVETMKMILVK